jgi:hypothetical protein
MGETLHLDPFESLPLAPPGCKLISLTRYENLGRWANRVQD